MDYAQYKTEPAYREKQPGAGVRIVLFPSNGTKPLIAATGGLSGRDDFEIVPIEEAGEEGVNELVTGRHTLSGSMSLVFTPERNDKLPTRQNFLGDTNGVSYTVFRQTGDGRVGTDPTSGDAVILDVYEGVKFTSHSSQVGARGAISVDLSFLAVRRYNGDEWSAKTGP